MPVTVIPITPKRAISPRHRLWHICHDPSMLAAPETLPVAPITFSFMFLFICYPPPSLISLQPAQQFPSVLYFQFFPSVHWALLPQQMFFRFSHKQSNCTAASAPNPAPPEAPCMP